MYRVRDYGAMIGDRVRMDAYVEALRRTVTPGSVVLDLGTGAGIFALLACRSRARHVYAIEPSNIVEVGREIAAANHYSDCITFLQKRSEEVELPERVNVIISDIRGVLPFLHGSLRVLIDARTRLLAPAGAMIGRRDTLWAVVVDAPELYRRHFAGWDEPSLAFDQEAGRRIMANTWDRGRAQPDEFLTEPRRWATIDYQTIVGPDVSADIEWTVARPGTAHGLVVWFDAELADGVGFSNAPGKPELIYSMAFFPWPKPVLVEAEDMINVKLDVRLFGEHEYVWSWKSRISGPAGTQAIFDQTSLLGEAVSPKILQRRAEQHTPALNEDGQMAQFILGAMDGQTSLRAIAGRLRLRFPGRFSNVRAAMGRIAELSERFSL